MNDFYIKIISDPFARHQSRDYAKHNMYSLVNKVFRVKNKEPQLMEVVSTVDKQTSKLMCYVIERDEFLRVVPQFEKYPHTPYWCIPVEFAMPYTPQFAISEKRSKGWAEYGKDKFGITTPTKRR